jgi:diguanylate cyclase (GGDEF)-like protein
MAAKLEREALFCNCVLVVESSQLGGKLVGIVTPADLAWGALQQLDLRAACARDVMTPNPITTQLGDLAQGGMQALTALREYRIRYLPIVDDHQRPLGVVTLDDIVQMMNVRLSETRVSLDQEMRERKLAEEQMHTYALRMRHLLDALPDLVLVLDELGDRIEVVPTQLSQREGEGGLITNCTVDWLSDANWAGAALKQVRHAIRTQTQQVFEYSLQIGLQTRWFLASISPMSDHSAMWVARDISDRKLQEATLKTANARLQQGMQILEARHRDLAYLQEVGEVLQTCNTLEECWRILGDLLQPLFPHCGGEIFARDGDRLKRLVAWGNHGSRTAEFDLKQCWALRRGRMHTVGLGALSLSCEHYDACHQQPFLCLPLQSQGQLLGVFSLRTADATDLDDHKQKLAAMVADQLSLTWVNLNLRTLLREESIRDPLTRLFNRRYLEETLMRELARAQRDRLSLGILMADLDHFKQINDTYGHAAGDLVLQEVAQLLQQRTRPSDIPCRFGGEEIVLVLPGASFSTTWTRAQELCAAVQALVLHWGGKRLPPISISVGVASFPTHGETLRELLDVVDQALYRAKNQGRNRVEAAELPGS